MSLNHQNSGKAPAQCTGASPRKPSPGKHGVALHLLLFRRPQAGFSLIELALVIMVVSAALVPVLGQMGAKNQRQGDAAPTLAAVSREKGATLVAGNTLMERAIAGEILNGSNAGADVLLNLATSLPNGGTHTTTRNSFGNAQPVYYEWVLKDVSFRMNDLGQLVNKQGNVIPVGSSEAIPVTPLGYRSVQATLKIYRSSTDTEAAAVFTTYLSRQVPGIPQGNATTGIQVISDISGSMCETGDNARPALSASGVCAPFLIDRFHRGGPAQLFDDAQLDLTLAQIADDPSTPYRDDYPAANVLGLPGTFDASSDTAIPSINDSAARDPYEVFFMSSALNHPKPWWWITGANGQIKRLSQNKTGWTAAQVTNNINTYQSKMEAMHNAMLGFLVNMESNTFLMDSIRLGYTTFSSNATLKLPLSSAELLNHPVTGQPIRRFRQLRDSFSWINRRDSTLGTRAILAGGATNISESLSVSAGALNADPNITQKIMILLTDGEPTAGITNSNSLINYTKSTVGDNGITLFTVNMMDGDFNLLKKMAEATPNGAAFDVQNPSELQGIFEQIAWEVQRIALDNLSDRHRANYM
jgi:hypothetical protein